MLKRIRSVMIAGLITMPILAQQGSPALTERVRVNVVEVPVTVVDRDGNPVRGLGLGDFRLFDEGTRVDISFFEVVDREALDLDTERGRRTVHPVAKRHFVLLFDLTNSMPGTIARVRSAAQEFVRNDLDVTDVAAVVTFSLEHGFRFVTSFTSNRDLLIDAIETLGHPKYFKAGDPLLLSAVGTGLSTTNAASLGNRKVVESEIVAYFQDLQRRMNQFDAEYRRSRLEGNLKGMGEFARLLDGVRGTKQVILLSEGFDARLVHGRDGSISETIEETESVLAGEVWKADFDSRYGFASAKKQLDEMAELFRRSDVVLHAIDIRGLRSDVDPRTGYSKASTESLFLMAEPTGGEVFKNANDMSKNFERLVRGQEVVYVLGFHARSTGTPGSFHDLRVELSDGPRGARVGHRAGYYEEAPMSELQRTLSTADIVLNDIPQEGVAIDSLIIPFPASDERNLTVVITEINGESLLRGVEGSRVEADLFIYAFDETDAVLDYRHQNLVIDLDLAGDAVRRTGLKFYGALRLPPGSYSVKTLLRMKDSDRFGFERDEIEVQSTGERTILPPLLFEPEGKWVMVKSPPRSRIEVPYPFHVSEESFVPAVTPHLEAGENYRMALFAYNLDFVEEPIRAGVRSGRGDPDSTRLSVVGHQPMENDEPNKLLLSLDTTGLEPGPYYLDLRIGEGKTSQQMTMPFTVAMSEAADRTSR